MTPLIFSIAALFVGPIAARLAGPGRVLTELFDGYVVVAVGGLVVLHLLPDSLAAGGAWAAVAAVVGALVPLVVERRLTGGRHHEALRWILAIALSGLALHAVLDGVALAAIAHGHGGEDLALGVALHRLPLGLLIWTVVQPRRGAAVALGLVGIIAGATLVGFGFGGRIVGALPTAGFAVFQAFIAGSLLHVAVHEAAPRPAAGAPPLRRTAAGHLPGALGALAAVATLIELWSEPGAGTGAGLTAPAAFVTLAVRGAPMLLLAFLGMVLLHTRRRAPCGCLVAPAYASRHLAGGSPRAGLAFLVAAPALGLDALLISVPLLGAELALLRLLAAVATAALVAALLGRAIPRVVAPREPAPPIEPILGVLDRIDHTLPWMAIGLAVAALLEPVLAGGAPFTVGAALAIPAMALLGAPLYLCAAGVTPLVVVLLDHGLAPGAAIAFLVTAPALHPAAWRTLRRLHGRHVSRLFAALVISAAVALGFLVDAVLPSDLAPRVLHGAGATGGTPIELASVAVLTVLFVAALARSGPRGLVDQVLTGGLPRLPQLEGQEPGTP